MSVVSPLTTNVLCFILSIFLRSHFMVNPNRGVTGSMGRDGYREVVGGAPIFDLASELTLWGTWAQIMDTLMKGIESYMGDGAGRQELRRTRRALLSIWSELAELRVCSYALRSHFSAEKDTYIISILSEQLRHNWDTLVFEWEERKTRDSWLNYYNESVEDRDEFLLSLRNLLESIRQTLPYIATLNNWRKRP